MEERNALLEMFKFESSPVRTALVDGEPWFLASDVAEALGYKNPADAVRKHCRKGGVAKRDTPTTSGIQAMLYINEPNLFRLTAHSKLPAAAPFEAWIFEEVLPTIRRKGGYIAKTATDAQLKEMELAIGDLRRQIQEERQYSARVEGERDTWKSLVPYGAISSATGTRKVIKRRGTYCAYPRRHDRFPDHPGFWDNGRG